MEEIKQLATELSANIHRRLIADLKKRQKVGVSPLISDIKFEVKRATMQDILITFTFSRKVPEYSRINGEPFAVDPLFNKIKPMYVDPKERPRFGKNNIYNKLNGWFEKEVIPELAKVSVELGSRTILEIIEG